MRRVCVLVVCCEWFKLTGFGRWGPNGCSPHCAHSALPFHGDCCEWALYIHTYIPIPYKDMSVQLDEKTFLVALEKEEVFRFSCEGKVVTSLKLSGLIRITVPRGCMAEGDWMKLMPTHNLFFNVGKIRVVKVLPLEMMNLNASDYAVCLLYTSPSPRDS